jgi:DNA-binding PadR family transcriptional regulator
MLTYKRSPLALAVLALLIEAPMHPYRMQQLIRSRGKDQVINVRQRGSLYQTIERLQRDGLIAAETIEREGGRPDRTIYAVTPLGRKVAMEWLRTMLAEPQNEFPEFPVALSFLGLVTPSEVLPLLKARLAFLDGHERKLAADLSTYSAVLPRVLLLENEYMLATARAERQWVEAVIADIRDGRLEWGEAALRQIAHLLESEQQKPG